MDRREFVGLMCASILFPQNLVKGIVESDDPFEPASEEQMQRFRCMVPKKFLMVSLGSDEHPACKEYVRFMKVHYSWKTADDFLSGHHGLDNRFVPRTYELVTTEHLVLGVGSKRRPVPEAEYLDFRNEVFQSLRRGKDIIATPHTIKACTMPDIACGVEGAPFPLVLHFDDPLFQVYSARRDLIQWEAWERRQKMDLTMAIGGGSMT